MIFSLSAKFSIVTQGMQDKQCTCTCTCTVKRAPVFGRHQFFGTSEHYGKASGNLLSGNEL